ncbi:MAG: GAF domain-containing protein, partial [Thermoguttaceae bacterium]
MSNTTGQPDLAGRDLTNDVSASVPPAATPAAEGHADRDLLKQQQVLVALGRQAATSSEPVSQMQDAAALLAEMFDADGSGTAEFSPDGQALHVQWTPKDPASSRTDGNTTAEATDSLAGFAIAQGHPVVVSDLPAERRFTDSILRSQRLRSVLAVPLNVNDRSFGVLLAGSRRASQFGMEDAAFAEAIGHLVAGTIARCRAEASLAQERRLTEGMFQGVDALVLVLDTQWQVVRINPTCERVSGFLGDEVKGRPIWDFLAVPEEVEAFQRLRKELFAGKTSAEFQGHLLTKHSHRRQIAWTCSMVSDEDSEPQSILVTGIEMTAWEQRTAEEGKPTQCLPEEGAIEGRTVEAFRPMPIPIDAERRARVRRAYPYMQRIG